MPARYLRETVVLSKIESTYGVDSAPTEAANAVLVSDVHITPVNADNVDRSLIRGYMGASEQLVGSNYVALSFAVELAGSGSAGTAPAYGHLLRACGLSETVTASVRTEYNLATPVTDSVTVYYFCAGVKYVAKGCRGNVRFSLPVSGRPKMEFTLLGIDGGATATTPSATTLTAYKTPALVTDANTGDITLGCTYTAATPTLTGGTGYPSQGIELDLGNAVAFTPLLGGETVDISDRALSGTLTLDLTAAQEVSFLAGVKANTTQSIGLMHGTTAGYKVMLFLPSAQLINPQRADVSGKLLQTYTLRGLPTSGNDEFKLVIH